MAVSYTGDTRSEHNSVSEIDFNGRVVRTVNNQHKNIASIQFNMPYYLTLAVNNHVIVADGHNERIVVLTEDLQLKRVLINSLDAQPHRLCFSQQTGVLFVGCSYSNEIRLTEVTNKLQL